MSTRVDMFIWCFLICAVYVCACLLLCANAAHRRARFRAVTTSVVATWPFRTDLPE